MGTFYLVLLRKAIIVLLKFLTAFFLKNNIENKDSCMFDSYKRKSVRILRGFQIRASNTAIKYY